jgi:DNA-binding beta-propeller fold protein YncE
MKRVLIIAVAATFAAAAWASPPQYKVVKEWRSGFKYPWDGAISPNGNVYIADQGNHRIQYFTPTGSFLGSWGGYGSGPGEFNGPIGIDVSLSGTRVYVADYSNQRIQYFNRNEPAVAPASLGKVKALFR